MENQLRERPLGTTVPDSVHAVCCHLPTLADVIGYEERNPEVMRQLQSGYPRFVFHPLIVKALEHIAAEDAAFTTRRLYALPSQSAVDEFLLWLAAHTDTTQTITKPVADFFVVALPAGTADLPATDALPARAKSFLQHTGLSISSRQAEAYLVASGVLEDPQPEVRYLGASSEFYIKAYLKDYIASKDIHLANSGMNAFYAALKATREVQAPLGRTRYVQLGWLYLDTQRILEKCLGQEESLHVQFDVFDKAALEAYFAQHGNEIAALVTELPTNPLIQTPDVDWLSELCTRHNVIRIYDPTVVSVVNVDVLPHCDLLVTSLTKYAASRGDVMIGALALNPDSPFALALRPLLAAQVQPPHESDCDRLAAEITDIANVCAAQNDNAQALLQWLGAQAGVSAVHHPLSPQSAANYARIARSPASVGAMLTVEIAGGKDAMEALYNATPVVKGPSFGTDFTMMSPFMYMAHYEDVTCEEGRAKLSALGLNPELLRISVGTEPQTAIREAFAKGLAAL